MARKLPPLHTLTAFEAVAKYGSFSRAAEEMALTHSAISHKIKQLEDHLGVRLFVRLPRHVVLTSEGSLFLSEVQAALSVLEGAAARVSRRKSQRGLRVNVLPPFAGNVLVKQLPDFLKQHPEIDLEIDATPRLENNDLAGIDVFVRYGKGDWPGFESVKLMSVDLFPVCSPGYLPQLGALKSAADLGKAVLLRHTMEPWEPWFRAAGIQSERARSRPNARITRCFPREPVRGPRSAPFSSGSRRSATSSPHRNGDVGARTGEGWGEPVCCVSWCRKRSSSRCPRRRRRSTHDHQRRLTC
ncbi:MAG: LysR family transcriptional regulator [Betaproteobacteria bacterium]|nr:LysR family transcriptional regulator [Betaproteobacteria bacterium]